MLRDQKSIGELIKYYRLIHGISQSELAHLLHVTVSAISNWERGLSRPSVEVAHVLAKDMHMTLDEFFISKNMSVRESQCSINDEIKLKRLYFKLQDYTISSVEKVIKIGYHVRGLAVTEASLKEQCQVYIYTRSQKITPSVFKITAVDATPKTSSPELDEFPLRSHAFLIEALFEYTHLDALDIHLELDDETAIIPVSQRFNQLITEGLPSTSEESANHQTVIESQEFGCYLTYMMEKHGMKKIQELFLKHTGNSKNP